MNGIDSILFLVNKRALNPTCNPILFSQLPNSYRQFSTLYFRPTAFPLPPSKFPFPHSEFPLHFRPSHLTSLSPSTFHPPPSTVHLSPSNRLSMQPFKRRSKRFRSGFRQQGIFGDGGGAMLRWLGAFVQMFDKRVSYPAEMLLMGCS